jgi:hypothetical protein
MLPAFAGLRGSTVVGKRRISGAAYSKTGSDPAPVGFHDVGVGVDVVEKQGRAGRQGVRVGSAGCQGGVSRMRSTLMFWD